MGVVQEVIEIDALQAEALVRGGEAILVDVREEEEWVEERVPYAILSPMSDFDAATFPTVAGKKVVVMCLAGVRSAAVVRKLVQSGHSLAFNLKGGIEAWKEAGLVTQSWEAA